MTDKQEIERLESLVKRQAATIKVLTDERDKAVFDANSLRSRLQAAERQKRTKTEMASRRAIEAATGVAIPSDVDILD